MADHDGSYHTLFSNPELVEDLLCHFVPEYLTEPLNFSAMERVSAKFSVVFSAIVIFDMLIIRIFTTILIGLFVDILLKHRSFPVVAL